VKPTAIHRFALVLETLFAVNDGWIELRALPAKAQAFVKSGDNAAIQRFIDLHLNENIFLELRPGRIPQMADSRTVLLSAPYS
jgi:hypothetical protein